MVFFKNGLGFSLLLRCGSFCVGGSAFCWLHSFPRVSSWFLTTCWAHSKCILSPATTVALLSWQLVVALCNWLLNHFSWTFLFGWPWILVPRCFSFISGFCLSLLLPSFFFMSFCYVYVASGFPVGLLSQRADSHTRFVADTFKV